MSTQLKIDLIVDDKGTVKIKQFTEGMQSEVKKSQQHLDNFAKSATTAFGLVAGYLTGGAKPPAIDRRGSRAITPKAFTGAVLEG